MAKCSANPSVTMSIVSLHFELEAFQIFAFGTVERDRVIGCGRQTPDDRDATARVEGSSEDDLLKEIERHVAGAGERQHVRAGIRELHGVEVDVLVAARG